MTRPHTNPGTPAAHTEGTPAPHTTPGTPTPDTKSTGTPPTGPTAPGIPTADTKATTAPGTHQGTATPDSESPRTPPTGPTTPGIPTADTTVLALARTPPAPLRSDLDAHLAGGARAWLDQALDEAAATPGMHGPISVWELRLAEAGRRCGLEHADAARVLILHAARADTVALTRVYQQGTAAERRAVLHALPHLVPGPDALPLVEDALRTNDTRLLAAAVGPYTARHLDPHQWRHAVLKCLFTGVPVDAVADLGERAHADAELARMLGDYAAERTAAGRPVPEDLYRVLALTDPTAPTRPSEPEEQP